MLRGSGNRPSFCTTSLPRESHLVSSIFVVSAFTVDVHYFVPAHLNILFFCDFYDMLVSSVWCLEYALSVNSGCDKVV